LVVDFSMKMNYINSLKSPNLKDPLLPSMPMHSERESLAHRGFVPSPDGITRRKALKMLIAGAVATGLAPLWAQPAAASLPPQSCSGRLALYNLHTEEGLKIRYLTPRGNFDPKALRRLNHFFRCHHTNQVHPIDPRLYLLLDRLRQQLGAQSHRIELISGFRSEAYNRLLRQKSGQVAKNSYHLQGMAADIRLEGVSLASIHQSAQRLKAGGVGRYNEFIHVDVGPVRSW
jgi:uncharacterized protein YcbK (DUF882 family)